VNRDKPILSAPLLGSTHKLVASTTDCLQAQMSYTQNSNRYPWRFSFGKDLATSSSAIGREHILCRTYGLCITFYLSCRRYASFFWWKIGRPHTLMFAAGHFRLL